MNKGWLNTRVHNLVSHYVDQGVEVEITTPSDKGIPLGAIASKNGSEYSIRRTNFRGLEWGSVSYSNREDVEREMRRLANESGHEWLERHKRQY